MSFDLHETMDKEVNEIIKRHLSKSITQETCDEVMADLIKVFGYDVAAQVILDDEDESFEIQIKDILSNVRSYKSHKVKVSQSDEI